MAVITRPPHPRFSRYHDKSIPFFLPLDPEVIRTWLDPKIGADDPVIKSLLDRPKIYSSLSVTRVKSFVRGEALDAPEELLPDA
ncbi:hypothetical protein [Marinimicrobium sp. C2-29]|uniref:hypothetical protein n=1 Tax=Marinimicrobium sp. C2-29 TaxID=3139825 RepID=UPI0031394E4C